MVEECWGNGGSLLDLRPQLGGRRVVLLIEARGLPATDVCHKPPHQIVTESGAVDHLDKEEVRDRLERIRDIHRYGYCSARKLTLDEARKHPSRNGSQVLSLAGRSVYPVPSRRMRGGAAPLSSLPGGAVRWAGRSDPSLMVSLPSKSGL